MGQNGRPSNRAPTPPAGPPQIPISPVPTCFNIGQKTMADGSMAVLLQVSTPSGVQTYFLAPDEAMAVGETLLQKAGAAKSNLIIPE